MYSGGSGSPSKSGFSGAQLTWRETSRAPKGFWWHLLVGVEDMGMILAVEMGLLAEVRCEERRVVVSRGRCSE